MTNFLCSTLWANWAIHCSHFLIYFLLLAWIWAELAFLLCLGNTYLYLSLSKVSSNQVHIQLTSRTESFPTVVQKHPFINDTLGILEPDFLLLLLKWIWIGFQHLVATCWSFTLKQLHHSSSKWFVFKSMIVDFELKHFQRFYFHSFRQKYAFNTIK